MQQYEIKAVLTRLKADKQKKADLIARMETAQAEQKEKKQQIKENLRSAVTGFNPRRKLKLAAVIMAIILIAAATLGAVKLVNYLYVPGLGLVDMSGEVVLPDGSVVSASDITVYSNTDLIPVPGAPHSLTIYNVCYTGYQDVSNLTVQTMAAGGSIDGDFPELVAVDENGNEYLLTAKSGSRGANTGDTLSSYNTFVTYTAKTPAVENITLKCAPWNFSADVAMRQIDSHRYDDMEWPEDNGITLVMQPVGASGLTYQCSVFDTNPFHMEIGEYVIDGIPSWGSWGITGGRVLVKDSLGEYHVTDGGGIGGSSTLNESKGQWQYSATWTFQGVKDQSGISDLSQISGFRFNEIDIYHSLDYLDHQKIPYAEVPMPQDGETIALEDCIILNMDGISMPIHSVSRSGNTITVTINSAIKLEPISEKDSFPRVLHFTIYAVDANGNDRFFSNSTGGSYSLYLTEEEAGQWFQDFSETKECYWEHPNTNLDKCKILRIYPQAIVLGYTGNWEINY